MPIPDVIRLPIWAIPHVVDLPLAQVETLQVLADLIPYRSLAPRERAHEDPDVRAMDVRTDAWIRRTDFEAWTADGARLGLLTWPERDALVHAVRRRAWECLP